MVRIPLNYTTTLTHDSKSETQLVGGESYTANYTYDAASHVVSVTYPDQSVVMWGFVHTEGLEDELFFIHSEQGSTTDYEERMTIVKILDSLSVACIVILVLLLIYRIWNLKKE